MRNISLHGIKRLSIAVFAMILGIGIFASDAHAQSASVKIDIPFDFEFAGRTFSSGEYRLGRLDQANPSVLILKNRTGSSQLIMQARQIDGTTQNLRSVLTFDRYVDAYVLTGFKALGQTNQPAFARADRFRHAQAKVTETVNLMGN